MFGRLLKFCEDLVSKASPISVYDQGFLPKDRKIPLPMLGFVIIYDNILQFYIQFLFFLNVWWYQSNWTICGCRSEWLKKSTTNTSDDELFDRLFLDLCRRSVQAASYRCEFGHVQRRDTVPSRSRASGQLGQEVYVANGQLQGVHFGQAFLVRKSGYVSPKAFERLVDALHAPPLPEVRRLPLLRLLSVTTRALLPARTDCKITSRRMKHVESFQLSMSSRLNLHLISIIHAGIVTCNHSFI